MSRLRSGLPPRDSQQLVQGLIPARVRGLPGSLSQSTFDDPRSTGVRLISHPRVILPGAVQHMVLSGTPIPDTLVRETLRALAATPDLDRHIRSRTVTPRSSAIS
ncbi:MAG: hypothetical protein WEE89_13055 [Gemmatimonadota bacterium]